MSDAPRPCADPGGTGVPSGLTRRCARPAPASALAGAVVLAAAAASAQQGEPPGAGETVASVTVDLPAGERERAARYVAIAPGSPYDPEAVRRAVELLFATGEYEDVAVLAGRGEQGLALWIRPRAAPRFAAARVTGDRVVSPRAAQRLARLTSGEPLWPARLERAARDVALALAADGWLEARVEARAERGAGGAATAVFQVYAGPRARVTRVEVKGGGPLVDPALLEHARPRRGEVFRRARAERAAESMRRALVERGRWRAEVTPREAYDPRTGGVELAFEAAPGPFTRVEFSGAALPAGLRGTLTERLREGRLSSDALEEAADRIETTLREQGHRDPLVAYREEPRPGGIAAVYDVVPGPQAQVSGVRVVGADGVEPPLPPGLRTRLDAPLRDALVDEDARALRRALEERGYAAATVEPDVPDGGGLLTVTFRVRPGPRTHVAGVNVDAPVGAAGTVTPPVLPLTAGEPYRVREVAAAVAALTAAWRNAGYLSVEAAPEVDVSDDKSEARVSLRVTPGPRTVVDRIVIAGLEHTREEVVRRELAIAEDEPLGLARVLESRRRLGALSVFRRTSLRELDPEALERRSVLVAVEEAPRTTVAYGVGYAERELLRGSLEVTQRDLFGLDRSLTAFGRASFRGSRVLLSYREPWLFGRRQELFLTGFREREDRESFDFTRLGGLVQTARALGARTSLILRLQFQRTQLFNVDVPLSEVDRQFQSSTISGPSVSLLYDTRDDPLDPRAGVFLGADVQLSQRFLGGDRFVKGFFQASAYERLAPRVLLAGNVRLGVARTFGLGAPAGLPLADRFFAGGDYSLRGFKTDTAGPQRQSEDGTRLVPVGGNALLLGGVELRFDTTRFLSLALFSDAGNVYPLVSGLRLSDLRYTAGVGLRYKSALGPLRVDWGYKLDRRPGESASRLHVTVGHAF